MRFLRRFVVTRQEALRMLGARHDLLTRLERSADIPHRPGRTGYTAKELRCLLKEARSTLGRAPA